MVYKDEPQDRQVRVLRGNLTVVGLEGGTETTEGGRGVELVDFPLYLFGDEFALEVYFPTTLAIFQHASGGQR